jgi:hypothetical protein
MEKILAKMEKVRMEKILAKMEKIIVSLHRNGVPALADVFTKGLLYLSLPAVKGMQGGYPRQDCHSYLIKKGASSRLSRGVT